MGKCWSSFRAKFSPNEDPSPEEVPIENVQPKPPEPEPLVEEFPVARIVSVDMCLTDNGRSHHTDKYETITREKKPQLVIRRGQPFSIVLSLQRPYDKEKDDISFIFTLEDDKNANFGRGTLVPVVLKNSGEGAWTASIDSTADKSVTVTITPSANAIIGTWNMEIDSKLAATNNDESVNYKHPEPFIVICNPWCVDDQVYMQDERNRTEFVMSETGLIWRGSHTLLRPCVWNYAQFEESVLECSLYLLKSIGKVQEAHRHNCVEIVRAIAAAVNEPDDRGVLIGNWSGDYSGGTAPTKWVGSMKILQEYYKSKKPVKYGQCWVFAGVVTSVCRSLGIPCRPVTNYSSAHDTHNSVTIDYFVDEEGKIIEELKTDSVWNFHVWNEVWLTRPDLEPEGSRSDIYGGWQVIDSTPQELSDGFYRCGPASVEAIRRGDIRRPYDSTFVYAEVNADKLFWLYKGASKPLKLLQQKEDVIGMKISTKAVGRYARDDITDNYKYAEKSKEERDSMLKALQQSDSKFSRYYLNDKFNDIRFDLKLRDDIVIGSPFNVVLAVENVSTERDYEVTLLFRVETTLYTGASKALVKKDNITKTIAASAVEEFKMEVTYDDYYKKLTDQCFFNVTCLAVVRDTNFEYFAQDDFRVRKPDINIKTEGDSLYVGEEFSATASFTNPLPIPLKKGQFLIEGPGLGSPLKIKLKDHVKANGPVTATFKLTARTPGEKTIAAKFTSKELEDVDGFANITVLPKKEQNGTNNPASNEVSDGHTIE